MSGMIELQNGFVNYKMKFGNIYAGPFPCPFDHENVFDGVDEPPEYLSTCKGKWLNVFDWMILISGAP